VVPLAAHSSTASVAGTRPPDPVTTISPRGQSAATSMPSAASPAAITRVSWLSSAPDSRLVPRAKAAQTSARFVMLFDPGGRIEPSIGRVQTGMGSGSVMVVGRL